MSELMYELWREVWIDQHPGRVPPTNEEVNILMAMFNLSIEEIIGLEASELN